MRFDPVRLLALLTVILVAGLGSLWIDEKAQWRNQTWTAPKPLPPDIQWTANASPSLTSTSDAAQFATILERPLFAPDRRPPPPPAPPPPPDPMADIQIYGIFTGVNSGVLARVDGKLIRVKVNQAIGAWTLKSIVGRDITFNNGDETRQLHLTYARLDTLAPKISASTSPAKSQTSPNTTPNSQGIAKPNSEDAGRENIRRRNELRAARGLPLITE